MDAQSITLPLAFVAGLLSFVSPCVLPLVPAFMGYLGGTAVMTGQQVPTATPSALGLVAAGRTRRRDTARTLFHALFFVLGFTMVFVLLGASATFIGRLLLETSLALQRVGGVLLVVFGLRLMGVGWSKGRWLAAAALAAIVTFALDSGLVVQGRVESSQYTVVWLEESVMMGLVVLAGADWALTRRVTLAVAAGILNFLASFDLLVPNLVASALITLVVVLLNKTEFFYAEKKLELKQSGQTGYLRSLLFGLVFGVGWTPCVGPILAGILVVASTLQTVGQGILLLTAYSLGLGIPFLLVGLAFGPLSKSLRKLNRHLGVVSIVSGVLLALMGILIYTDSLTFLAQVGGFFTLEP